MTIEEWARNQQERRQRFEDEVRACKLKPPEAFSDEPAPPQAFRSLCPDLDPALSGPKSHAVQWRIARSCCGWAEPPTTEEFYDAFRTDTPDQRQGRRLVRGRSAAEPYSRPAGIIARASISTSP